MCVIKLGLSCVCLS